MFCQVVLVDLTLAGDNAIVVGMAARGLELRDRRRAILAGTIVATVLRVGLAIVANRLLGIVGLTLAGGVLLAWVAWKMVREFMAERRGRTAAAGSAEPTKTVRQAMIQIVIADISMSVDNVLAVAGTAREHFWVLVFGLALSIALMAIASNFVAKYLHRWPWLVWLGVAVVAYVSITMIYQGTRQVSARFA